MKRDSREEFKKIIDNVAQFVGLEAASGQEFMYKSRKRAAVSAAKPDRAARLKALYNEIKGCTGCSLYKTRTNFVFGAGSPEARLVFVGEAPGREEDMRGLPFVGRAGQLLTRIIEAIGLTRDKVFICNILKCRPPENRNPLPTEIMECEGHLLRQLDIIKPRVICTLGKFAAQTLLKTDTPISGLRGHFQDYHGIKLMPTYHPAYLLRNPGEKRAVWEDMKKIRAELAKTSKHK